MGSRKAKNEVASTGDEAVPGRYSYRPAGSSPLSGWRVLVTACAPLNTRQGHDRLVGEWNEREKGEWVWRWDDVLPCDFDYPPFLPPEQGARHHAACIWFFLCKEERELNLPALLQTLRGRRQTVNIPNGKARVPDGGYMFGTAGVDFRRGKRVHRETYANPAQAALAALLANLEIRGEVELPADEAACAEWQEAVKKRLADALSRFDDLAGLRTDTQTLRDAVARMLMQWFVHGLK